MKAVKDTIVIETGMDDAIEGSPYYVLISRDKGVDELNNKVIEKLDIGNFETPEEAEDSVIEWMEDRFSLKLEVTT